MFFFTMSKISAGAKYITSKPTKKPTKTRLRFEKKVFHLDGGDEEISRGDFVPLF